MTPKQRLNATFAGKHVDRVPIIIPGGMMAGTLYALVKESKLPYPGIHTDAGYMVQYTQHLQQQCGIDNTGVPFCMTVEAEDFGADVDLGDSLHEPRITDCPFDTLTDLFNKTPINSHRHSVTLDAIKLLSNKDVPVIGNIIGPMSLLTSLVNQGVVYRALENDKSNLATALSRLSEHIIRFAEEQIKAGADIIVMADPSAAGDILGPEYFEKFMAPVYQKIFQTLKKYQHPIILHICGRITNLVPILKTIPWDGLSVDSLVSLKRLREVIKNRVLMGNVSTHLMAVSDEAKAYQLTKRIVETTAILAPACGLSTKTPLNNIRAMVQAAKDAAQGLK